MNQQGSQILFEIPKLTKTCRPGSKTKSIAFNSFPNEKSLCVVTCINDYMSRTQSWREQGDNIDRSWLLLSVVKPHHHIVPSSVARWLKETIKKSGFSSLFTGHSTRSASTSKAKRVGLSTQYIWEVEPGNKDEFLTVQEVLVGPRKIDDQDWTRIIKINDIKYFALFRVFLFQYIVFHHYTSPDCIQAIKDTKKILRSTADGSTVYGCGVYGTPLCPENGRKKIAKNNYADGWRLKEKDGKVEAVFRIKIKKNQRVEIIVDGDRDIYLYNGDLEFEDAEEVDLIYFEGKTRKVQNLK
ncbi:unnamed protein product [Mytilus coruscus]|uniref:Uncharacterized protein n=1 Tax=Mytilus coruscus TaxID=42192 RepID=A0A6J8CAK1_MYTCO|nr:unnamed protein product [Mytilus coruscus]